MIKSDNFWFATLKKGCCACQTCGESKYVAQNQSKFLRINSHTKIDRDSENVCVALCWLYAQEFGSLQNVSKIKRLGLSVIRPFFKLQGTLT